MLFNDLLKINDTNVNLKLNGKSVNVALWVRLDGFDFGIKKKIPFQRELPEKTKKTKKKR